MMAGFTLISRKEFRDRNKPVRLIITTCAPLWKNIDMHLYGAHPTYGNRKTRDIIFTLVVDDFGIK